MESLDYFGVDEPTEQIALADKVASAALPAAVGAVAALLSRNSHPILAFLGASALVSNTQAVLRGERTPKEAAQRMGRHVIASAAALASPVYPLPAYLAGAFAADLLFDGHGDGVLDEWARYVGIDMNKKVATDAKHENTAIVVTEKKK